MSLTSLLISRAPEFFCLPKTSTRTWVAVSLVSLVPLLFSTRTCIMARPVGVILDALIDVPSSCFCVHAPARKMFTTWDLHSDNPTSSTFVRSFSDRSTVACFFTGVGTLLLTRGNDPAVPEGVVSGPASLNHWWPRIVFAPGRTSGLAPGFWQ